jgi:hypothetical protein
MAACAWNLRKWLVIATIFLFWQGLWQHLRFLSREYFYHDWLRQQ